MGTLFLGGGTAILGVALGWIHVDPDSVHAPRWVLGVLSAMFALSGIGAFYYGLVNGAREGPRPARDEDGAPFPVFSWLIGLAITGGMTAVAAWVAFGPGEREFSGGIGIGWISVGGSSSGTSGRVVFGIGAVLVGLFTLWGLIYGLRRLAGRGRPGADPEPGHGERR